MKNVLRILALTALLLLPFQVFSQTIRLKNGKTVEMDQVLSKDQFGIVINSGKKDAEGNILRNFIPFAEMNPASLTLFPFCDMKAVERTYNAVIDRATLIRKKFATEIKPFETAKDCTALLRIHTGVPFYRIFFIADNTFDDGLTGFIFSDAADSLFYGKIFLHGLLGPKDTIWVGNIYPTEKTVERNQIRYPVFTVIAPQIPQNGLPGTGANLSAIPTAASSQRSGAAGGNPQMSGEQRRNRPSLQQGEKKPRKQSSGGGGSRAPRK